MDSDNRNNIDVAILCGGLGTRLKGVVDDRPKPMAEINGRPFLDILIDYIASFGFRRFILCTGYKSKSIINYYQKKSGHLTFSISEEKHPLDTGGALKNAEALVQSDPFLVFNGDSFCRIDITDFLNFHINKGAVVSIALTTIENPADYGAIRLDGKQRIVGFNEKAALDSPGLVNAGIYTFAKKMLAQMPANRKLSLEYDFFPGILSEDLYGYVTDEKLVDIGTPERLRTAREFFETETLTAKP
jgi:NDP-sugar pyrophosphorylase family protein